MEPKDEEMIKFALRLPKDLYEAIGQLATENYRSTNNEIIMAVKTYVKSLAKPEPPEDRA